MNCEELNARAQAIVDWLVPRLAGALGVPPSEIDANEPLSRYGLGSVEAVVLVGDLEEWLSLSLEPTLLWDYPTITRLAAYLAENAAVAAAGDQAANA